MINQIYEYAILGSVFGLVLAVWLIGVILWTLLVSSRSRQVRQRLGLTRGGASGEARVLRLWKDGEEAVTTVVRRGPGSLMSRIDRCRREAGIETPAQSLVLGTAGVCILLVMCTISTRWRFRGIRRQAVCDRRVAAG